MYKVNYSDVTFEGDMSDLSHVFCLCFEFRARVKRSRSLVATMGLLNDGLLHRSALQQRRKPITSTAKDCKRTNARKAKELGEKGT